MHHFGAMLAIVGYYSLVLHMLQVPWLVVGLYRNRTMDDINPLDVTVAYVSVINKSKTIKCLGYL